MLNNVKKDFFTLTEYREKVAPTQTDKDGNVIFLYSANADRQHSYISAAEKKDMMYYC
ncbi:hypothetical protein [Niabella hibiscisoli]|uniref:hypothetical protein n=1 Tax=Niabella hibiscisoli TaxID=1825928 RepID=UPI001F0D3003|nr:hypothetical protein [Niabella hibiscisoli]MCH5721296.1 hypothetical protein [Niabella hibiscisoli]